MVSFNSKIILAFLFAFVAGSQSKDCPTYCTMEYNPVCATNGREYRLFGNPCTFKAFECKTETVWTRLRSLAPCSDKHTTDFSAGCEVPCTREYVPVCGTNGDRFEVFNNLCLMKNAHCKDGKTWRQTRMIECDTVTSNLSAKKTNGCEVPCTREYVPVCGTNGDRLEVFSNLCLMNNAHCNDGKTWHQTRMSECEIVTSELSTYLNSNCETPCTDDLNPVCGFNGKHHKLFDNLCIMNNEHCKDGLSWFQNRMMDCLIRKETEEVNCEKPCQTIYAPVCGFDGISFQMFDNKCLREVAACDQHVTFVNAPLSSCEAKTVGQDVNCAKPCQTIYAPVCGFDGISFQMFDNKCLREVVACDQHVSFVDAPLSACETKIVAQENCEKPCQTIYAPVCGFNGKSYQMFDNKCLLEVAACDQHVTFVDAPLSACETKTVAQEENCLKPCPFIYAPVCGFNGRSYEMFDNSCVMEVAACNQHVSFVDAPLSACETKIVAQENCEKPCQTIYAPVCGFDGKSYQMFDNSCVMEVAACDQHVTFVDAPLSACETKTVAQEENCEKPCPFIYLPVCGFNGRSYQMFDNSCVMEVAACDQHVTFVDAPLSACETKTVAQEENCEKPCPFIYLPVCGFNGRSYQMFDNSCVMEVAACSQHVTFVDAPLSACV